MENRSAICNIVPSPYDSRDWKYEARIASSVSNVKIPKEYRCRDLTPVKNQGQRGTCVAMTLSCTKEFQEGIENPLMKGELMSPNSLYFYRMPDHGMYCRNALKILREKGMCTERVFPYTDNEPESISKKAVKEALRYRVKSYAKVETIKGAKRAILEYGPLLIAFPYFDNGSARFWVQPTINSEHDGGHAVAVIGWNKEGFIIRNSWGDKWNGDGHVIYPYDEWGSHWELWSCVDENSDYLPEHLLRKKKFCGVF